jgi:hypothetical protein
MPIGERKPGPMASTFGPLRLYIRFLRDAPFRSFLSGRLRRQKTEPRPDDGNSRTIEPSADPIASRNMVPCPAQSELIELIAGRLSRERHEVLDEHVRACAACQAILETLDEPHDVCISAVRELAHLAMSQARRPVQHVIDRLCSLPAAQADPHSSSQFDSPLLGERTLGDFRILRLVGRGGMGMVYEARQISLGRTVALKTLPFAGLLDPRRLQRFQNEARAAASLEHPHIVPVYAVGVDRGVYFYAMRFLDGPNLAEIIDQWRGPAAGGSIAPRITETTATPPGAIAGQVPPPGANGGGIEETPEPRQNGASGRDPGLRGRRDQDPGPHGRREPSQPGWAQGTACVADGSTASFARRVGHAMDPRSWMRSIFIVSCG